ncbi:hydroxyacid dehydrogenase [Pollutimonas harenae]|uniref:Hydroxyacid dehydrogenase n=1 Tax=Pollutimonas harenae TaxID=657015 RepID=A0A853GYJ1_9BURK|nr:hydroxyacid dehydrogenase [Pollutimonas harenae]NYT84840.1 hydroxyacid dehydrogenase [Pollutimonas harenae]TEA72762.1 hydroxyacid dehydrogenase [Pollutimonas harenae]
MTRVVRLDVWTAPCFDEILAQDTNLTLHILERNGDQARNWDILSRAEIYHISAARDEVPVELQATTDLIRQCPNLKCVSTSGAGYDTVDVDACSAAGILVVNQAGGNAQSVAEHAIAFMLALARRFPESIHKLKYGTGFTREDLMGNELNGKTLGLVGLGHIGTRVAKLANAFGMTVLACDPYIEEQEIAARGARSVSMDELLAASDIISLHCPRTQETLNLFDAARFRSMKKNALFVTTARGGIHNETDLYDALLAGHIGGAGLDVWTVEPPLPDNPLLALHNVVATYHTAGVTQEGRRNVAALAAQQILQICRKEVPHRMVNPEIYSRFSTRFSV